MVLWLGVLYPILALFISTHPLSLLHTSVGKNKTKRPGGHGQTIQSFLTIFSISFSSNQRILNMKIQNINRMQNKGVQNYDSVSQLTKKRYPNDLIPNAEKTN